MSRMKRRILFWLLASLALLLTACSVEPYSVSIDGLELTVDPSAEIVSDGENTFPYSLSGQRDAYRIEVSYPDGSAYWQEQQSDGPVVNGWSDNYSGDGYPDGDTLCSAIIFQFSLSPDAPSPAVLILALLTFFCGAFYAFSPKGAWRLQTRSLVKEPAEPAEGALSRYRAGGIVLMAAGAVIGVLAFIL